MQTFSFVTGRDHRKRKKILRLQSSIFNGLVSVLRQQVRKSRTPTVSLLLNFFSITTLFLYFSHHVKDVAHHITSALASSALSLDGTSESELLDHYHSCLSNELVKYGVGKSVEEIETLIFPREELQRQYEVAMLDICRIVFAYAWRRWKAESEPTEASFNRNAYNKSLDSVLWLITRCHFLLEKHYN